MKKLILIALFGTTISGIHCAAQEVDWSAKASSYALRYGMSSGVPQLTKAKLSKKAKTITTEEKFEAFKAEVDAAKALGDELYSRRYKR